MCTSSEVNGLSPAAGASGVAAASLAGPDYRDGTAFPPDGRDGERDTKRVVPALEVQVGRPLARTPCDSVACSAPAAVSVSLRADWAPHFYCAEHWPAMDAMLRERGHTLRF